MSKILRLSVALFSLTLALVVSAEVPFLPGSGKRFKEYRNTGATLIGGTNAVNINVGIPRFVSTFLPFVGTNQFQSFTRSTVTFTTNFVNTDNPNGLPVTVNGTAIANFRFPEFAQSFTVQDLVIQLSMRGEALPALDINIQNQSSIPTSIYNNDTAFANNGSHDVVLTFDRTATTNACGNLFNHYKVNFTNDVTQTVSPCPQNSFLALSNSSVGGNWFVVFDDQPANINGTSVSGHEHTILAMTITLSANQISTFTTPDRVVDVRPRSARALDFTVFDKGLNRNVTKLSRVQSQI